jgi:hypothetical protein
LARASNSDLALLIGALALAAVAWWYYQGQGTVPPSGRVPNDPHLIADLLSLAKTAKGSVRQQLLDEAMAMIRGNQQYLQAEQQAAKGNPWWGVNLAAAGAGALAAAKGAKAVGLDLGVIRQAAGGTVGRVVGIARRIAAPAASEAAQLLEEVRVP